MIKKSHAKIWRESTSNEETAGVRARRQEGPGTPETGTRPVCPQHGGAGAELCDVRNGRVHLRGRQDRGVPKQEASSSCRNSHTIAFNCLCK